MLKISGTNISLTRGDSAYLEFAITDTEGESYILKDGDKVRVQVRESPNGGELLFDGDISIEDNLVEWYIRPSDTESLAVGKYYWDAQLETAKGDIYTFITKSTFKLTDEVTENG